MRAWLGLGTRVHAVPFHRSIRGSPSPPTAQLKQPTAQVLRAEVAATPRRGLLLDRAGVGLGTRVHAVPFHRSIKVLPRVLPVMPPTAQALPADVAATAERKLPAGPELSTRFQEVPFHRRVRGLPPVEPTAQALLADVAATPERLLPAGAGLGTCFHVLPFQTMISVLGLLVEQALQPTAQALLADVAATPERLLSAPGLRLGTCFHEVPFHRTMRVLVLVPLPVSPTAHALLADVAATPKRLPLMVKDATPPARPVWAAAGGADADPTATPAASSGTATSMTGRVANRGMRTGCHLPPGQPAGSAGPVNRGEAARWHRRNSRKWGRGHRSQPRA